MPLDNIKHTNNHKAYVEKSELKMSLTWGKRHIQVQEAQSPKQDEPKAVHVKTKYN